MKTRIVEFFNKTENFLKKNKRIFSLLAFIILATYILLNGNLNADKNSIVITSLIISGILAYNKVDGWGWFLFLCYILT